MIPHNPKHWGRGSTRAMSLVCSEAELLPKLESDFLTSCLTSYSLSTQFLAFRSIWGYKWGINGPKWFPIAQNIDFDTRTISLPCSEAELLPKLECHILKSFLTSHSPSTQFLAFRLIWGFWKWSQMILHTPKHWFCHQNHVSSMLRSWVTPYVRISHLEVLLDLIQPFHLVLGLQVNLRLPKMVPNDSLYPKTLVLLPEPCL